MNNNKHNNNYNNKHNNNNNNNNVVLQVTLFDCNNRYKPISTLIEVEDLDYFAKNSKEVKTRAIQRICNQRGLSGKELVKLGYTIIKVRNYSLFKEIQKGRKG